MSNFSGRASKYGRTLTSFSSFSSKGADGLVSQIGDDAMPLTFAYEFGFPLVVVAANCLDAINKTLQTLTTAVTFHEALEAAGIILNDADSPSTQDTRQI